MLIISAFQTQKNIKTMFHAVLLLKLCVLIIDTIKKIVLYRGKDAVNKFIRLIFNEYNYCKRIMRKYFCKNLIMSADENLK